MRAASCLDPLRQCWTRYIDDSRDFTHKAMNGPLSAAGSRDLHHYHARTARTSSSANNRLPIGHEQR